MSGDRRSEWSAGLLLRSSKSALLAQPFTIYAAPRGGRLLRDDQLYSTALSPGGYEQIGFARSLADARQRADFRPVAGCPVLRDRHDDRGQLPGSRGLRAVAVTSIRAAPRHGDLYRPVGQRFRASDLGAGRSIPDL